MSSPLLRILDELVRLPLPYRSIRSVPGLALGTLKGPVRQENQDRALAVHLSGSSPSKDLLIVAVSDGMGGMEDGGGAASLAISEFVAEAAETFEGHADDLEGAAHRANAAVFAAYRGRGGATLTAAVFAEGGSFRVHSGDSRLYTQSASGAFALLTRDDTPNGLLAGDDLECPMSSQLMQFAGIGARFAPVVTPIDAADGATWLLTSDGAHDIGRLPLRAILKAGSDAEDVTRRLLDAAEAAGAYDNATAAVVRPDRFRRDAGFDTGGRLTAWTPVSEVVLG